MVNNRINVGVFGSNVTLDLARSFHSLSTISEKRLTLLACDVEASEVDVQGISLRSSLPIGS